MSNSTGWYKWKYRKGYDWPSNDHPRNLVYNTIVEVKYVDNTIQKRHVQDIDWTDINRDCVTAYRVEANLLPILERIEIKLDKVLGNKSDMDERLQKLEKVRQAHAQALREIVRFHTLGE